MYWVLIQLSDWACYAPLQKHVGFSFLAVTRATFTGIHFKDYEEYLTWDTLGLGLSALTEVSNLTDLNPFLNVLVLPTGVQTGAMSFRDVSSLGLSSFRDVIAGGWVPGDQIPTREFMQGLIPILYLKWFTMKSKR